MEGQPARAARDHQPFSTRFRRQTIALIKKNLKVLWRSRWSTAFRLGSGFVFVLLIWLVTEAINAASRNQIHVRDSPNPPRKDIDGISECRKRGCTTFVYTPAAVDGYVPAADHIAERDLQGLSSQRRGEVMRVHQVLRSVLRHNKGGAVPPDTVRGFRTEETASRFMSTHLGNVGAGVLLNSPTAANTSFVLQLNETDSRTLDTSLPLQVAFSQAIAREMVLPERDVSMDIALQPYAHPRVSGAADIASSVVGELLLVVAALMPFVLQVSEVVGEKEQRLRPSLAAMGMLDSAYWTSWHVMHVLTSGVCALCICVSGIIFDIDMFVRTDFAVLFFEFFFFMLAMTGLAFLLSTLIGTSLQAMTVGKYLSYFILGIVQIPAFGSITDVDSNFSLNCTAISSLNTLTGLQEHPQNYIADGNHTLMFQYCSKVPEDADWVERRIMPAGIASRACAVVFAFFPPSLLAKHLADIAATVAETGPDGTRLLLYPLQMSNVSSYCQHDLQTGALCDPSFSVGASWGIFLGLYALYSLAALYLDNVLPNAMGERKPPLYLFSREYWGLLEEEEEEVGDDDGGEAALESRGEEDEDEDVRREEEEARRRAAQGSAMAAAIEVRGLRKTFWRRATSRDGACVCCRCCVTRCCWKWEAYEVVRGPRFGVRRGQLFALLGPNGAGKSTLLHMLTGQLPPTAGSGLVCGHPVGRAAGVPGLRRGVGVCPQFESLFSELTALEHLQLLGEIRGLPEGSVREETTRRLEEVHLAEAAHVRARELSGGMRRRLSVAMALVGDAAVLLLDEPTAGMDPVARRQVWDAIEHAKPDRAIVLTTHSMEEADMLGDRIGIMVKGRLRCIGSSVHLKSRFGAGYRVTVTVRDSATAGEVKTIFKDMLGIEHEQEEGPTAQAQGREGGAEGEAARRLRFVAAREQEEEMGRVFEELERRGGELGVEGVQLAQSTLEEVFLRVAQEAERAEAERAEGTARMAEVTLRSGEVVEVPLGSDDAFTDREGRRHRPVWGLDEDGELACTNALPLPEMEVTVPAGASAGSEVEVVVDGRRTSVVVPEGVQAGERFEASIGFASAGGRVADSQAALKESMSEAELQRRVDGLVASVLQQTRAIFIKSALLQGKRRCSSCCMLLAPVLSVLLLLFIQLILEVNADPPYAVRCTYCGPTTDAFGQHFCGGRDDCFDFFWPPEDEQTEPKSCEGGEGVAVCRRWARETCGKIAAECGGHGSPDCFWPGAPGSRSAEGDSCRVATEPLRPTGGVGPLYSPPPQFLARDSVLYTGSEGGQAAGVMGKMFEDVDGEGDAIAESGQAVVQRLYAALTLPGVGCGQISGGEVVTGLPAESREALCALLQHEAVLKGLKNVPCCLDLTTPADVPGGGAVLEEGKNQWTDAEGVVLASGSGLADLEAQLGRLYNRETARGITEDLAGVSQTFSCVRPRYPEALRERVAGRAVLGLEEGLAILSQALELPVELHPNPEPNREVPGCHEAGDCETPNGRWAQACDVATYEAFAAQEGEVAEVFGGWAVGLQLEDVLLVPCAENATEAEGSGEEGADCGALFRQMKQAQAQGGGPPCLCVWKDFVRRFALRELRNLELRDFFDEMHRSREGETSGYEEDVSAYQLPLSKRLSRLATSLRRSLQTGDESLMNDEEVEGRGLPFGLPGLKIASDHRGSWMITVPLAGQVGWEIPMLRYDAWWEEPVEGRHQVCACRTQEEVCEANSDCNDDRGDRCVDASCKCMLEQRVSPSGRTYPSLNASRAGSEEEEGECTEFRPTTADNAWMRLEKRGSSQQVYILADRCEELGGASHVLWMLGNVSGIRLGCLEVDTAEVPDLATLNRKLYEGHPVRDRTGKLSGGLGVIAAFDFRGTRGDQLELTVLHNATGDCWSLLSFSICTDPGMHAVTSALNAALQAFLAERTGEHVAEMTPLLAGIKPTPWSPFWGQTFDVAALVGPMLTALNMMLVFPAIVISLVQEKTSKSRVMMRMMGLRSSAFWTSSYLFWVAVSVVHVSIFLLLANTLPLYNGYRISLFTKVDWGVQFVLLFLFSLCNVSFAFLWGILLSSNKAAEGITAVWVFGSCVLSQILDLFTFFDSTGVSKTVSVIFDMLPPFGLFRALVEFRQYSRSWSDKPDPKLTWSQVSADSAVGRVMIIFFLEAVTFLLLALYLDQVAGGSHGIPRHPLFFLGWERKQAKEELEQDSEVYETPPDVDKEESRVREMHGLPQHEQGAVVVDKLNKIFSAYPKNKHAVKDLTLGIKRGECFGMLGPNGAGKTTTINMLIGYEQPSSFAAASVEGFDIVSHMDRVYSIIGVCPQHDLLWPQLTAKQHLLFYGMLRNLSGQRLREAVVAALKDVALLDARDKAAAALSGGMRRRLSVAIALIGAPLVCFLDEPSTGLDPSSRRLLWECIRKARRDRAVLLTTHNMEEAEGLCDRLGMFVEGRLVCVGHAQELTARYGHVMTLTISVAAARDGDGAEGGSLAQRTEEVASSLLERFASARMTYQLGDTLRLELPTKDVSLAALFAHMSAARRSGEVRSWGVSSTTLEDAFIKIARSASKTQRSV